MKKLLKSIGTMVLAFAISITSVPISFNVFAVGSEDVSSGDETSSPTNAVDEISIGIDSYPDVDILLTKGETNIDAINFKDAVEQALSEKGLDSDKLHIFAESSSDLQTDGSFAWAQYSGISRGYASGAANGAGENPLSYYRAGSLRVEDKGSYSNVYFYGNWYSAGSLFALAPIPEPQPGYVVNQQTVSFDYTLAFGDSIAGAGYVINAYDAGDGYIRGQMLGLMNSNSTGKGYGFYANGQKCGIYEFALPKSLACSGSNAKGHSTSSKGFGTCTLLTGKSYDVAYSGSLKIVRKENTISIYTKSGKQTDFAYLDSLQIDKIGDRFGYFMFTYDHGCKQTGSFALTNLTINTQSRMPFKEVLTNSSSKLINDDLHFVVNIDDKADDSLTSVQLTSLMDADNGYDGLHYIGWGNDDTNGDQMKCLLANTSVVVSEHEKALLTDEDYATGMYFTDSNGVLRRYRGLYLSQQEYDYQFYDLVQKTADYIYNVVLKYMNKDDVVVENPARLFVDPESKAYNSAVSPGIYSYGKWTVNHYSKTYEGSDAVNADLYGGHDLIEVDGDNISAFNVWTHQDKQSKYETQERTGYFEDVVVGTTSKDDQIYVDSDGTLFKYSYDLDDNGNEIGYVNYYSGLPQTPNGEVTGTIKTGEHSETRVVGYNKIVPTTKSPESDDSNTIRSTIDSATMTHLGTYIVFTDYGEYSSNNSWITLSALNTSGQAVYAWKLNGVTDWSSIQTTDNLEYYETNDTIPVKGKIYYTYEKSGGYTRYYGTTFKTGTTYYENVNDVQYYETSDKTRDYSKTYYAYGTLTEFRPGWNWNKSDFTKGVTYFEKNSDGTYTKTEDEEANSFKVYYYFKNSNNLLEIGAQDAFLKFTDYDYVYYEYSEDSKYFRTSDSFPDSNKTYYYKSSNSGQYVKFSGSYFNWNTKYYEMYECYKYLVTQDKYYQAGKTYYVKDENGNYVRYYGTTFKDGEVYYEHELDTSDNSSIVYSNITIYSPREIAIDTLNLKCYDEDSQAYKYTGPIVSGTITQLTEDFNVTPVEGDNTTVGTNKVFYVMRQQVDGNNAGLSGKYSGSGMSDYHVGKFKYWDENSEQYIDTGYVTFQIMDVYSAENYCF